MKNSDLKLIDYQAIWFTGQPGAGKTVLGKLMKSYLEDNIFEKKFVIVDGDDIRELFENKDYSIQGRLKNVKFVQDLCQFLIKNQIVPIVCMVSPNLIQREEFKSQFKVLEIFVNCSEIRGREHFHVDYYEAPINNFLDVDTSNKSEIISFDNLIKHFKND
jgi:adenylylsulfate kinase